MEQFLNLFYNVDSFRMPEIFVQAFRNPIHQKPYERPEKRFSGHGNTTSLGLGTVVSLVQPVRAWVPRKAVHSRKICAPNINNYVALINAFSCIPPL